MPINQIANSIKATGWGNRKNELFIDCIVRNSALLSRFTLIDGVKSKAQIPIYDLTLTYGSNICDVTAGTTGELNLDEKEVTVSDFTWYFSNCKQLLESTYRSEMLRKGSMNEQTLDDDLKEWLFDMFAKKNAEKAISEAYKQLKAKIKADTTDVVKLTHASTAILPQLEAAYKAFSKDMLDSFMGQTDKDFRPVILMNSKTIQKYQLEMAAKYTTTPQGIVAGEIPQWMSFELVNFNQMGDDEFIFTPLANLLLITDEYGDVNAIKAEFDNKKNSDEFFGNFKLGFDYRRGDMIVSSIEGDAPAAA